MDNQNSDFIAKNSNDKVSVITDETTCIVTFNLAGAFKERQSNANTREEVNKMKASPIIEENHKGRFVCSRVGAPGRKLRPDEPLPRNYFSGPTEYKPCRYHKCYLKRIYNPDAVQYLSSLDARPKNINKSRWENMTEIERLQWQFSIDANAMNSINPGFTFELVG